MSSSDCSVGRHSSDKPVKVVHWDPIKNKARKVLRKGSELHQESLTCISKALCMLTQNAIFSSFVILLISTVSNRYRINLKYQIQLRLVYHIELTNRTISFTKEYTSYNSLIRLEQVLSFFQSPTVVANHRNLNHCVVRSTELLQTLDMERVYQSGV